eukprot:UN02159
MECIYSHLELCFVVKDFEIKFMTDHKSHIESHEKSLRELISMTYLRSTA